MIVIKYNEHTEEENTEDTDGSETADETEELD